MESSSHNADALSTRDYARLQELIYSEWGIRLTGEKRTMLEGRLRKRWKTLNLASCSEYCKFLFNHPAAAGELPELIDVVTTNKTDFFRESRHFDFLTQAALASLEPARGSELLFWSAGCSSGEEPYTLAMILAEYALKHSGFRFRILATDISSAVLEHARRAVFEAADVEPVPAELRHKYLLRSKNRASELVRIVPELRERVEVRRLNLMQTDFGIPEPVDVIFCRNVLIYFDQASRSAVLNRFYRQLRPGGYLFLGHSESLNGFDLPFQLAGPTVYRKSNGPAWR
jgi:chemotaxis protein methyltransferase CheR